MTGACKTVSASTLKSTAQRSNLTPLTMKMIWTLTSLPLRKLHPHHQTPLPMSPLTNRPLLHRHHDRRRRADLPTIQLLHLVPRRQKRTTDAKWALYLITTSLTQRQALPALKRGSPLVKARVWCRRRRMMREMRTQRSCKGSKGNYRTCKQHCII